MLLYFFLYDNIYLLLNLTLNNNLLVCNHHHTTFQIQYSFGSTGVGTLHAGLSTTNKTATYTQLADFHEKRFDDVSGRNANVTVNGSWTLTGLTAGASEELWIGFASTSTTGTPTLYWGADSTGRYPDFIMKATALPASITT